MGHLEERSTALGELILQSKTTRLSSGGAQCCSRPRTHLTRLSYVSESRSHLSLLLCGGTCGKREVPRRLSRSYFRKITKTDTMLGLYRVSVRQRRLIYSFRLPEESLRGDRTYGGLFVNTVYHYHHCISPNILEPELLPTPQSSRDLNLEHTFSNQKCLILRERFDLFAVYFYYFNLAHVITFLGPLYFCLHDPCF